MQDDLKLGFLNANGMNILEENWEFTNHKSPNNPTKSFI